MKQRKTEQDANERTSTRPTDGSKQSAVRLRASARPESVPSIDRKWAWHNRALLAVRDRLLKERGERLAQAAQPLEPHSMDIADSASDEFDHDRALAELSAEQDALYEVDEALGRIRDGTYGVCEATGEPIPAARLRAIPWTRFAREVEERLERKGTLARPHLGPVASVRGPEVTSLEESEPPEEAPAEPEPKEESLWHVYSPPGKHLHEHKAATPPPRGSRRAERKGRAP